MHNFKCNYEIILLLYLRNLNISLSIFESYSDVCNTDWRRDININNLISQQAADHSGEGGLRSLRWIQLHSTAATRWRAAWRSPRQRGSRPTLGAAALCHPPDRYVTVHLNKGDYGDYVCTLLFFLMREVFALCQLRFPQNNV